MRLVLQNRVMSVRLVWKMDKKKKRQFESLKIKS